MRTLPRQISCGVMECVPAKYTERGKMSHARTRAINTPHSPHRHRRALTPYLGYGAQAPCPATRELVTPALGLLVLALRRFTVSDSGTTAKVGTYTDRRPSSHPSLSFATSRRHLCTPSSAFTPPSSWLHQTNTTGTTNTSNPGVYPLHHTLTFNLSLSTS